MQITAVPPGLIEYERSLGATHYRIRHDQVQFFSPNAYGVTIATWWQNDGWITKWERLQFTDAVPEDATPLAPAVSPPHPHQPLVQAPDGITRFKRNEIVRYLLDFGRIDLNALAVMDFSDEDRVQFVQLIGYSRAGFCDLSYVSDEVVRQVNALPVHGAE